MAAIKDHGLGSSSSFVSHGDITGITIMTALGALSATADLCFAFVIMFNMWHWRVQYRSNPKMKQCMVLILSLLIADLFTGIGAGLGAKWLQLGDIFAPSGWSWLQGSLIQLGTVANAWSVIALAWISLSTFTARPAISHGRFYFFLGIGWAGAILTTIFAAVSNGDGFYGRAALWSWISVDYKWYRLWLNILWILLAGLGTVVLYIMLLVSMLRQLRLLIAVQSTPETPIRLVRAIHVIGLYSLAYLAHTIPVTVGFLMKLANHEVPDSFMLFAGCMLASSGFLDALIYCFTRRVLIHTNPQDLKFPNLPNQELEEEWYPDFICTCPCPNGPIQRPSTSESPSAPSTPPLFHLEGNPKERVCTFPLRASEDYLNLTGPYRHLRHLQGIRQDADHQNALCSAVPKHKPRVSDVSTTDSEIQKPPKSRGKLAGLGIGFKKINTERTLDPALMRIEATMELDVFEERDVEGSPALQQNQPISAWNRKWFPG